MNQVDSQAGSSRRVALILDVGKTYDRHVIHGIAKYVKTVGQWSLYVEDDPLAKIPNLNTWNGDGIIADFDDVTVAEAVSGLEIPVVGIGGGYGGYNPEMNIPYVATDNTAIAKLAANHLLERGFKSLAFCGYPRTSINVWSDERATAFEKYLEQEGFHCSVYRGRHRNPRRWNALMKGLMEWLETLPKPVGIFAANDTRARHVLEASRRLKLRVPEDVAVLGVDNDELMCELAIPPLSSVVQGTDRLGYEAAALLDRLMDGQMPEQQKMVIEPVGITTRQSTDVMAVEDDLVAKAVRYIRQNANRRIQVTDVVKRLNVSRSTLDSRFRKLLGRSVHEEIQRVQINYAKDLLSNTTLSLKDVARQSGYNNIQYMTMVFRRELNVTPGEFRKKHTT